MGIMEFYDWLKEETHKRGWTQADFVRETGISPAHTSRLFNMQSKPGIDTFQAIAKAFNVPAKDVMKLAGIIEPELEEEEVPLSLGELNILYLQASAEEQIELLEMVRLRVSQQKAARQRQKNSASG